MNARLSSSEAASASPNPARVTIDVRASVGRLAVLLPRRWSSAQHDISRVRAACKPAEVNVLRPWPVPHLLLLLQ